MRLQNFSILQEAESWAREEGVAVNEATELFYIARGREMDKKEGRGEGRGEGGGAGNKVTILQETESWQGLGILVGNSLAYLSICS